MEKDSFSNIVERIITDEALCKKVATMENAEFEALLKENGAEDLSAEECAELLAIFKSYLNEDGDLSEEALDMVAGSMWGGSTVTNSRC